MSETMKLKNLEKKAWISYFQDGLWDIIIGYYFLVTTLNGILTLAGVPDSVGNSITIPMMMMGGVILWVGKQFITIPRMGLVAFGPKRVMRSIKMLIGLLIFFVAIALVAFIVTNRWEGWYVKFLLITIPLTIIAFFLDFRRLYFIAALGGSSGLLTTIFSSYIDTPLNWTISNGIVGSIIFVMGLVYFVRFIQRYPKPSQTIADAGEGVDG